MTNSLRHLLLLLLAAVMAGCAVAPPRKPPEPAESPELPEESPTAGNVVPAPSAEPAPSPYPEAISRASAAYDLSQSAQSNDDWRLVASRWQQAIALLEQVPETDPNYGEVAGKLADYRQSFSYAQSQADVPIPEVIPERVVRLSPGGGTDGADSGDRATAAAAGSALDSASGSNTRSNAGPNAGSNRPADGAPRTFQAPIVRRAGGTPVVTVTFNGSQTFEMIVDTGASGTVITQSMARTLDVEPVGEAQVATASDSQVPFQLGYVDALEVAGVQIEQVLVAIAGSDLSVGLLGQDFFSGYDVTIRQDVVEFQER